MGSVTRGLREQLGSSQPFSTSKWIDSASLPGWVGVRWLLAVAARCVVSLVSELFPARRRGGEHDNDTSVSASGRRQHIVEVDGPSGPESEAA